MCVLKRSVKNYMRYDIMIPNAGDSVDSCKITKWHVQDSSEVNRGDLLLTLETDKVSCDIEADLSGVLLHQITEGSRARIGDIAGFIEYDGSQVDELIRDLIDNPKKHSEEEVRDGVKPFLLKWLQYWLMGMGVMYLYKYIFN